MTAKLIRKVSTFKQLSSRSATSPQGPLLPLHLPRTSNIISTLQPPNTHSHPTHIPNTSAIWHGEGKKDHPLLRTHSAIFHLLIRKLTTSFASTYRRLYQPNDSSVYFQILYVYFPPSSSLLYLRYSSSIPFSKGEGGLSSILVSLLSLPPPAARRNSFIKFDFLLGCSPPSSIRFALHLCNCIGSAYTRIYIQSLHMCWYT